MDPVVVSRLRELGSSWRRHEEMLSVSSAVLESTISDLSTWKPVGYGSVDPKVS